jgi:DNA polymerase family A
MSKDKAKRLNIQAIARRDEGLMRTLIPPPGKIFVSIDLSSGEPTITGEFSKDPNYLYATFNGVGKIPAYRNGILMIDDIYLMAASVSPLAQQKIRDTFDSKKFDGLSFQEQWMVDSEVVKKYLKHERTIHKILALGLGYGMGPKKMVTSMYEKGYSLDFKTAKQFKKVYWELFSGVRKFSDMLSVEMESKGQIINPFGYRLTCNPRKAYNYFCQSSVSGIMHVYGAKLFALAPWAKFVVCIHDEFLCVLDENRVDEFREARQIACDSLNADLGWEVPIRVGYAPGKNLYEAK